MSEHEHEVEARLSGYLDGELADREARAVEAHLERCAHCRGVLDDLSEVRARAGALEDRAPDRDLWPAIRAGLDRAAVIDLADHLGREAGGSGSGSRMRRGVFLSMPQMAAAAAALVVLAAGAGWGLARTGDAGAPSGARASAEAIPAEETPGAVEVQPGMAPRFAEHTREVAELQEVLRRGRDRLDPNTVRILEKNLALIDGAIRESVEALAVDPGNPFVERHLQRSFDRKVTYLREAAALLEMTD